MSNKVSGRGVSRRARQNGTIKKRPSRKNKTKRRYTRRSNKKSRRRIKRRIKRIMKGGAVDWEINRILARLTDHPTVQLATAKSGPDAGKRAEYLVEWADPDQGYTLEPARFLEHYDKQGKLAAHVEIANFGAYGAFFGGEEAPIVLSEAWVKQMMDEDSGLALDDIAEWASAFHKELRGMWTQTGGASGGERNMRGGMEGRRAVPQTEFSFAAIPEAKANRTAWSEKKSAAVKAHLDKGKKHVDLSKISRRSFYNQS